MTTGLPVAVRAAVVALAGTELGEDERLMLRRTPPAGLILFQRNCRDRDQLAALIAEARAAAGAALPVLIDQEGGRVMRLRPPVWRPLPAAGRIGLLARRDLPAGEEAARLLGRLIAHDLALVGIDVDCAPVLDVPVPDVHDAIGDRAFAADPLLVARLGRAFIDGLEAGGVLPVIKHLPGHGRARVDSHHALPVIDVSRDELEAVDLVPFRHCRDVPFAMTAHVLLPALDPLRPATQSPVIIGELIRGAIGFEGVLLTDDISMGALEGDLGLRVRRALAAGCDLALHCTGRIEETAVVLDAAGPLEGTSRARLQAALARRRPAGPFDAEAGGRALEGLLAPALAAGA
jgi:beta-N-acetylhexosaminidase